MCRFVEAVCMKNGMAEHLEYHQKRLEKTFAKFFPGKEVPELDDLIPAMPDRKKYKWRIVYDGSDLESFVQEYEQRSFSTVHVEPADFDYSYKYEDRSAIRNACAGKPADCCVLFSKDGWLTDSFFSNIALLKNGVWYTPAQPLLEGVRRSVLLDKGLLVTKNIRARDVSDYEKISLINAMLDLNELTVVMQKKK